MYVKIENQIFFLGWGGGGNHPFTPPPIGRPCFIVKNEMVWQG
jgi:hypothetical protein